MLSLCLSPLLSLSLHLLVSTIETWHEEQTWLNRNSWHVPRRCRSKKKEKRIKSNYGWVVIMYFIDRDRSRCLFHSPKPRCTFDHLAPVVGMTVTLDNARWALPPQWWQDMLCAHAWRSDSARRGSHCRVWRRTIDDNQSDKPAINILVYCGRIWWWLKNSLTGCMLLNCVFWFREVYVNIKGRDLGVGDFWNSCRIQV